jgi:acyl carrier protein
LNQIDARIQEIARDVFGDNSLVLTDSAKVGKVPGWDSLGHVNFMLSLEDEFGVEFSEDEFVGFEDFAGLKRMLAEKLVVNPLVVSGASDEGRREAAS